ncbi:MAG TPA: alpha/beta hydrolase [Stellaceae bacterium]|nr:alpha/beta hydrolase [Stellaceae bacterium]
MPDPVYSTITIRGASVPLKRAGAGPAMLVLHGAGGSPRFLPAMRKLSEKFDVIIPQAPGFGGSDVPPWLETVSDLANFYLDFLDEVDLRGVHLVGLSLGGWVAADLAVRNASRLASLTLMDAPGIRVPGVAALDQFLLSEERAVRELYFDQKLADDSVARVLDPANEDVRLANQRTVAMLAWQPRFHDPQMQRWLHRIRIPTLILWGDNDRMFPRAFGEAWAKSIPGARLEVLPRCGHLPIQEQPEQFASLVADFCTAAAAAPRAV